MARILVADDDEGMLRLVSDYLMAAGHTVAAYRDGREVLAAWRDSGPPDLLVMDVMMPYRDGLSVLYELRGESQVPVILITAMDSERDELRGFGAGAQDYLTKPFSPKVLVARVNAILARQEKADAPRSIGPLSQDRAARKFRLGSAELTLAPKEYDLLDFLFRHPGQALSREQLLQGVWRNLNLEDTRTVDTHIKRLRAHLGEAADLIETVWSYGYRLRDGK